MSEPILHFNDEVFLSEYRESDTKNLVLFLNDPEIARNTLTIPYPYTVSDANWWLQRIRDRKQELGVVDSWAIRNRQAGIVGGIGVFYHTGVEGHYDEIGYWLAEPYRGKGLMSHVVQVFSGWQFDCRPKLIRLEAWVFSHNIASRSVLEKAGYTKEGIARKRFLKGGRPLDAVLYGRIRE